MSLFGGSAPLPRSSPESSTSESSSTGSSPSIVEIPNPHNVQDAQRVDIPAPLDLDDDLDTDTSSEENELEDEKEEDEEDEEEEPARPNRFKGEPRTWRTYTEADRRIVESLDKMQSSDLSAHLYNAHAMKRRLLRPAHELTQLKNWHGRDAWLKSEEGLKYTDVAGIVQEHMVPPNDWTTWPVPPTELSNGSESSDNKLESDQADSRTSWNASKQASSEELKEELLAAFLRIAKDKWNTRDTPSSVSDTETDSRTSRSRSRSKSIKSTPSRSTSRAAARMKHYSNPSPEAIGSDEASEEQGTVSGKRRGRKPQSNVFLKPVILADDARARQLLQPSIQSMMTKLDELALAIYRTRLNHFGFGDSGDSSMSGFTSRAGSSGPVSRSSSRAASRVASRATSRASSRVTSRASSRAPSKKVMGRSPSIRSSSRASSLQATRAIRQSMSDNDVDAMDSDSTYDDSSDWESVIETPRRRKRRRSSGSKSGSDTSTIRGGKFRGGSLDWSEVLGLAAVKGWDPDAIARTAQRCATLFGESMSFVPMAESVASKPVPKPVWYTPSTVPDPSILSTTESHTSKRPLFQTGTLSCPHEDCEDYDRKFASTSRVIEHCVSVHGYDPRTNDCKNEQRMVGGVHIDGFLQPIMLKPGWVNDGKGKAKERGEKQIQTEGSS